MTHVTPVIIEAYLAKVKDIPFLTPIEEKKLAKSVIKGYSNKSKAITRLFESQLRNVVKCAIDTHNKYPMVPFDDLISEGNLGLMNAIHRFDPFKYKTRLSTYSYNWIKKHLNNAIVDSNSRVHISQNMGLLVSRYNALEGKEDMSDAELKSILKASTKELAILRSIDLSVISLDDEVYNDSYKGESSLSLKDTIQDNSLPLPDALAKKSDDLTLIKHIIETKLNEQEQYIIKERFFKEVQTKISVLSKELGCTKQRINQIEIKAKEKMQFHVKRITKIR